MRPGIAAGFYNQRKKTSVCTSSFTHGSVCNEILYFLSLIPFSPKNLPSDFISLFLFWVKLYVTGVYITLLGPL